MCTPLQDRRFIYVTGKGGVGKTTVSAALARALARRGRRVLLTGCCVQEHLSRAFGVPPLDSSIREVEHNIWAIHLRAEEAMREYGGMMLRSRRVFDAVFNNAVVRSFLAGVPGLCGWAVLGKAWYHSTELDAAGRPRFDSVIYDAPATGHGVELLRVPKVIVDLVPPGILRRDAERAWAMLTDPSYTAVVVVTLPEELPTSEALELTSQLRSELEIPVGRVVVNGVLEPLFSDRERRALLEPRELDRSDPGDTTLACAVRRAIRERVQEENLRRLEPLDVPQTRLPRLTTPATTPAGTLALADHF